MKNKQSVFFLKALFSHRAGRFGSILLLSFVFIAFFAPILAPYDPTRVFEHAFLSPPFWGKGAHLQFLLGTDDLGRDLLSRLLYGARVSLGVGVAVVCLSASLGTWLGLWIGLVGGLLEKFFLAFVDVWMALPSILLAIVMVSVLGPSLENTIWALAIVQVPTFLRLARAMAKKEKQKPFFLAAKSFGASRWRLLWVHLFPNALAPLLVQAAFALSEGVLGIAALGFLGLGAQPPTPEWGTMLSDARSYLESAPWFMTLPGMCIFMLVLSCNLLGDALRDVCDPKLQKKTTHS